MQSQYLKHSIIRYAHAHTLALLGFARLVVGTLLGQLLAGCQDESVLQMSRICAFQAVMSMLEMEYKLNKVNFGNKAGRPTILSMVQDLCRTIVWSGMNLCT